MSTDIDFKLTSYNFSLPDELIAQDPPINRGESRLYCLDRDKRSAADDKVMDFRDISDVLPKNSLLIANNSKVVPARLFAQKATGARVELLLLTPLPLLEAAAVSSGSLKEAEASALIRPGKKVKEGDSYAISDNLAFKVMEKKEFGQARVLLQWRGSLLERVNESGELPLPPYIKRKVGASDLDRYQTVFASDKQAGSVAAPTAGLHFTPEIKRALLDNGHEWAELTLFVGYGTFSPVRVDDIRDHTMHAEYVELQEDVVKKILKAKSEGRPIISVGTTSTRVLEGIAESLAEAGSKELLTAWSGWLNCFIYPGKPIRVIDGMLTNFHLPESTLLMLVSAVVGRERVMDAYDRAVAEKMHFFSYGDAMLIS